METNERVAALRDEMKRNDLKGWIVTTHGPDLSEYASDRWRGRRWLTGFGGTAGTAVVTPEKAGLWVDSRYYFTAEKAVEGTAFTVFRSGQPGVPKPEKWLSEELPPESIVGVHGETVSPATLRALGRTLEPAGIELRTDLDLLDAVWSDRPGRPVEPVRGMSVELAGSSRSWKLGKVRGKMEQASADFHLLNDLSEIAWLLNIRGRDIPFATLPFCRALLGREAMYLFIDGEKMPEDLRRELERDEVTILPYDALPEKLASIDPRESILIDPHRINVALADLAGRLRVKKAPNIITPLKAIKNEVEIGGFRAALLREGAVLVRFLHWIERNVGRERLTEVSLNTQLKAFRAAYEEYVHDSFGAIIAWKEHAALPHYSADPAAPTDLAPEGALLIDTGAHYLDGTTDTTRTIALGTVHPEQIRDFTLVLKGIIALSSIRFPENTSGAQLDVLSRTALWNEGRNFLHGTGHGVGHFLDVHEGPQSLSSRGGGVEMKPGMVTTIEPGMYRPGRFGCRTENMVLCVEDGTTEFGSFRKFETVTFCPIDRRMIDTTLLEPKERAWIDGYHRQVMEKVGPLLEAEDRAWLEKATAPI